MVRALSGGWPPPLNLAAAAQGAPRRAAGPSAPRPVQCRPVRGGGGAARRRGGEAGVEMAGSLWGGRALPADSFPGKPEEGPPLFLVE